MLKSLIEKLEKIEYKLMKIKTEGYLSNCVLSQERCKSLTNMVNILGSLVHKTIQNKNYDDDIALRFLIDDKNNFYNESTLANLSSSEDFLEGVKNVLKAPPVSSSDVPTYLSNFQELLGDLVYSICEINNCRMKLASGIKVKDLMIIKNLYSTFWELMTSLFYPDSLNHNDTVKIKKKIPKENTPEEDMILSGLVDAVQTCLREMSKVKLEIEHYIKFNLMEFQLNKQEDEREKENNVSEEKNKTTCFKPEDDKSVTKEINRQTSSDLFTQDNEAPQTCNLNPTHIGPQESYVNPCLFQQNLGGWGGSYDCRPTFIEDPYSSFFSAPILYPPDVLFFEPPTLVFQSQMEPKRKNSLPKIYSVDSLSDTATIKIEEKINHKPDEKEKTKEKTKVKTLYYSNKKENLIDKSLFENMDEDLFSENQDSNQSEAEHVQLKEKLSSLFSMLRANKKYDVDDIFEPVKIEKKVSSIESSYELKDNKAETKAKNKKKHSKAKRSSERQIKNKDKEKLKPVVGKRKYDKHFTQTCNKDLQKDILRHERLQMEHPMKLWKNKQNEVIYDNKSVVELFKSNPIDNFNDESFPTEESNFCLWPVAAEYIYVSSMKGSDRCHSVSSANSISLGKSFEKSFYSLHMNKKYEQKHLYDGDLIVLDHLETLQSKGNSTYSLFNQSAVPYNDHESTENSDLKHLYSRNCGGVHDNNHIFSLNKKLAPADHRGLNAQQQTYAVHYADCGESFIINKKIKNDKIDFFNFNSYNNSQNWDSFISIMTSKVGPHTHINERRMFRKIVKNLASRSFHDKNLFGNVQTLTSSGGPFRLFDINGYPLTDSAGNVLKDPYGKSVVQLDSTGFPKDNIKVFDAAGNSPKDVNFDPTQKPQTNCIVVKLTDNFKRPLHLFDKYGRPLTDSNGKLLVNIHGRPLLRFDNFGRPNTDYRGGPLYTDNGFRWSFKMESFSKEQISNERQISEETLTPEVKIQNESLRDSAVPIEMVGDKLKPNKDNQSDERKKINSLDNINSKNSDIWQHVESILQSHSKKNKTVEKSSQTNLNANRTTVKHNAEVKEYLSSAIYPGNEVQVCTNNCQINENKKEESNLKQTTQHESNHRQNVKCNTFLGNKINFNTKTDFFNSDIHTNMPLPFNNNLLEKTTITKCFPNLNFPKEQLDYCMPSIFMERNNICKVPQLLVHSGDVLTKNQTMGIPIGFPTEVPKTIPSMFTFKNNEYLNNLCNQILKNKIEYNDKLKDIGNKTGELQFLSKSKRDFTDTTLTEFTSSFISRYTNDVPLYTDSPTVSVESHKNDPKIMKLLEDINFKFRNHDKLNIPIRKRNSSDQLELRSTLKNKNRPSMKYFKNIDQIYEEDTTDIFKPSDTSEETNTLIDKTNNVSNQDEINVKERMRTGYQSYNEDNFIQSDNNGVTNDMDYPEKENDINKHNYNSPVQHHSPEPINYTAGVYHGEYCCHFKNGKRKVKDSPFRFPSEEPMDKTLAANDKVEYVNGKNWLVQDRNKTHQYYHGNGNHREFLVDHKHHATKHDHFYPTLVKKPQRYNRDCNLVSFFGTPVKYVLNKLDTKLSLRQQGKEKKQKHSNVIYESCENDKKLKTVYHNSNTKDKYTTSKDAYIENKRSLKHGRHQGTLLALKSKSFSMLQERKTGHMSYSGSQDTSDKFSPGSSSQYNKCSSDTAVTSNHKHTHPQRRSRKYDGKKQKNEQYSFETQYVHTSHTTSPHHHRRREASPKNYKRQVSKSPKNKFKTARLFKKSGNSGKTKRIR